MRQLKLFLFLTIMLAGIFSCSDDEDDNNGPTGIMMDTLGVTTSSITIQWASLPSQYFMVKVYESSDADEVLLVDMLEYGEVPYTIANLDKETKYTIVMSEILFDKLDEDGEYEDFYDDYESAEDVDDMLDLMEDYKAYMNQAGKKKITTLAEGEDGGDGGNYTMANMAARWQSGNGLFYELSEDGSAVTGQYSEVMQEDDIDDENATWEITTVEWTEINFQTGEMTDKSGPGIKVTDSEGNYTELQIQSKDTLYDHDNSKSYIRQGSSKDDDGSNGDDSDALSILALSVGDGEEMEDGMRGWGMTMSVQGPQDFSASAGDDAEITLYRGSDSTDLSVVDDYPKDWSMEMGSSNFVEFFADDPSDGTYYWKMEAEFTMDDETSTQTSEMYSFYVGSPDDDGSDDSKSDVLEISQLSVADGEELTKGITDIWNISMSIESIEGFVSLQDDATIKLYLGTDSANLTQVDGYPKDWTDKMDIQKPVEFFTEDPSTGTYYWQIEATFSSFTGDFTTKTSEVYSFYVESPGNGSTYTMENMAGLWEKYSNNEDWAYALNPDGTAEFRLGSSASIERYYEWSVDDNTITIEKNGVAPIELSIIDDNGTTKLEKSGDKYGIYDGLSKDYFVGKWYYDSDGEGGYAFELKEDGSWGYDYQDLTWEVKGNILVMEGSYSTEYWYPYRGISAKRLHSGPFSYSQNNGIVVKK